MMRCEKKVIRSQTTFGLLAFGVLAVVGFAPIASAQSMPAKANVQTTQAERTQSWDSLVDLFRKDPLPPTDIGLRDMDIVEIRAGGMGVIARENPREQQPLRWVRYSLDGNVVTSVHIHTIIYGPGEDVFQQLSDLGTKAGSVIYESSPHPNGRLSYKMIRPEKALPPFCMITGKDGRGKIGFMHFTFPPSLPDVPLDADEETKFTAALKKAQQGFSPSTTRDSSKKSYPKFGEVPIPLGADWRTVLKFVPDKASITISENAPGKIEFPGGARAACRLRWTTFEEGRLRKMVMKIAKDDAEATLAYLEKDGQNFDSRKLTISKTLTLDLKWNKDHDGELWITISAQGAAPNNKK
jgi:hypothetical protein